MKENGVRKEWRGRGGEAWRRGSNHDSMTPFVLRTNGQAPMGGPGGVGGGALTSTTNRRKPSSVGSGASHTSGGYAKLTHNSNQVSKHHFPKHWSHFQIAATFADHFQDILFALCESLKVLPCYCRKLA